MNEAIKEEIRQSINNLDFNFFTMELERRENAEREMRELIEKTNLLHGGIWTSEHLCESIKIQKKSPKHKQCSAT
ncbi:hypothetical protein [Natranaerobius thermophilus]|uniref:Uncharacterized protein n=1 Tax=Natranaerobius thermophilus (strain ATCC BAA-1301 / DSM 18059 / JW/NM-WN-LF) TaxID=457570 RepID=B2A7T8_NATTJ|nr:hypothetical protein [Natranaerobius thermophilus]ACB84390.1 hypothetical protein Nther_0804 [Natranaerobius thermophilus JW/NM-WN-LF]